MACILGELENVLKKQLKKQLDNTKNSEESKEGITKAKERVAELSALLNEVGAMKKAMQGQVNTETNVQTKVKVLEDMLNKSEQSKLKTMVDNIIADKNIDRVHNKTGQTGIAFGPVEYSYSNGRYSHKQKDMPKEISELANQIGETLGRTKDYYNHVLINKFEDGIGIGMHPDNEPIYKDINGAIGAVAIYSIGSTKVPHIIENEKYTAKNNSLVEMASGSMYHSVGAADGIRYSFTFRHIPENNLPKKTTSVNVSKYDKPLADKIANKLQKLYSHIEVAYLNGQTEMRAVLEELSGGLTMFQLSNKRKQEFEQKLRKARPELADTKIDEVLKNIEQFSETESNGDEKLMKKLEILALHWTLKGNIILPEDGSKVMQALKIADKNKLDPFSYSNPNEITEAFAKVEEKTKPLNPDDYLGKGYSNKQELTKGVVVYDVDDNDTGREISRAMIDTHFGKEANPWCLLARKNNSIAKTAEYWYDYYPGDKKIAFKNGKLIAFYGDNQWWDRMDSPSRDIAIESKLEKDEEGRTPIQIEYVPMYSHEKWLNDPYAQKDGVVKFIRGNRNNGVYEEWANTSKNSNEKLELKEIRKNGVLKYSKKITINHYNETQKVDISINAPISKDMEFENDISEYYDNEVIGEYRYFTDFIGEDLEKRTFSEIRIQSKSNYTPYSIIVNEINMHKVNELKYYATDSASYTYEITKEKFDSLFNEIKIGKTIKEYNRIIKESDNDLVIPFQKQDDIIKGAAVLSKNKILVDITNRSTDTLAHEYAHFYIAGFRNTPIVQEAIKKWGSEEALVQAIGEEAVAKKGNAYGFWKRFSKWLKDLVANLDKASKEDLVKALTDAFLTNADLNTDAKKVVSINNNSQESKMRQLLDIYKDQDAPKIGGGLIEDVTRKSVYDEDVKAATIMKGVQDSTLKDMLPKVDGRTINLYEKAVNAWYGEMKRGTSVKNKLAELIELIKTIEYSPELMEELGWSKENETVPINSKGFNGYISIKDMGGKGSTEGDAKDIAMREVADGFVGEISNGRLNNSSTGTSYNALKDSVSGPTSAGSITYHGAAKPSIVMLARNGSFRGKPLNSETKEAIEYYFQEGASFVVGDMPGVDSQFINYLDEIGASYKIYHTGSSPRIVKEDIKYQKDTKDNYKQEADIIVPTETFQKNVNRKIECKE